MLPPAERVPETPRRFVGTTAQHDASSASGQYTSWTNPTESSAPCTGKCAARVPATCRSQARERGARICPGQIWAKASPTLAEF